MTDKDYWGCPTDDRHWKVKREGGERITQKRDGTIGSKDSYGNDPRRRWDTEH